MGRWGIGGSETRVGQECSIIRGGARLYSGGIHVGGVRGGSHSLTAGGGGSSTSERCPELGIRREKVVSFLDGPIWSKRSIAHICPARSHFQGTQSKERWGQGWVNVTANQEKEENEEGQE